MKSILNLFVLGMLVISISSCSDEDKTIYDGNASSDQTLLRMSHSSYTVPIVNNSSADLEVEVQSSTKFNQDRQFNIEYVSDDIGGDTIIYSFDHTVTIPAGKFIGSFNVHAQDNGLQDQNFTLILKVVAPEGNKDVVVEDNTTEIGLYRTCDIDDDFLIGNYMLTNVTSTLGPDNGTTNFEEGVVTISAGEDDPKTRVFSDVVLPIIGAPAVDFTINLVCGKFVFLEAPTNIQCVDLIYFGPAPDGQDSTFDQTDVQDSYIINYTEDSTNDCGNKGLASFKLTKV